MFLTLPEGLFVSFVRLGLLSSFSVVSCIGLLYTFYNDFMIIDLLENLFSIDAPTIANKQSIHYKKAQSYSEAKA